MEPNPANLKARRFPWRTLLKGLLFLVVSAITALGLFLTVISFTGRRELARTKADLLARGEKLSLVELLPPPVPPDENFFADPMWEELTDLVEVEMPEYAFKIRQPRLPKGERKLDGLSRRLEGADLEALAAKYPEYSMAENNFSRKLFNQERGASPRNQRAAEVILAATAPAEPTLEKLIELARRPGAQFPLNVTDVGANIDRTSYLLSACQLLEMRAWAHLALGKTEAARDEVLTMIRMAEAVAEEPLLISQLVNLGMMPLIARAIEGGLQQGLWTTADLKALEDALAKVDLLAATSLGLRGERGYFNQMMETMNEGSSNPFPGWYRWVYHPGLQALNNRMMQGWIEAIDEAAKTGYSPARTISMKPVEELKSNPWKRIFYLAGATVPNITNIANQAAKLQNRVDQVRIAGALERYRQARGEYPESLAALVPEYLAEIPADVITRKAPLYRREGAGQFVLWSVGENEVDDGGSEKDWVWGREE